MQHIARRLIEEGVPTPSGKTKWQASTIRSMLSNEKYMGDALLQKQFTVDFLQKKKKVNVGEVPQYYVENSHPAIIPRELFMRVQAEIKRRQQLGHSYNGKSVFSARIVCGDCGAFYGSKVWNSTNQFRRVVWQCNDKFKGEKCHTPHITEQELQDRFMEVFNSLFANKDQLVEDCELMLAMLTDTSELDSKLQELRGQQEVVIEMTRKWVATHASAAQSSANYEERYEELVRRYEQLSGEIQVLDEQKTQRLERADTITLYLQKIIESEELKEFDPRIWLEVIEIATVFQDGSIVFTFQDGKKVVG